MPGLRSKRAAILQAAVSMREYSPYASDGVRAVVRKDSYEVPAILRAAC